MLTMFQQGISNSRPKFEFQSSSFKQDTELTVLSCVIKTGYEPCLHNKESRAPHPTQNSISDPQILVDH